MEFRSDRPLAEGSRRLWMAIRYRRSWVGERCGTPKLGTDIIPIWIRVLNVVGRAAFCGKSQGLARRFRIEQACTFWLREINQLSAVQKQAFGRFRIRDNLRHLSVE